jgi:hypothetical protein
MTTAITPASKAARATDTASAGRCIQPSALSSSTTSNGRPPGGVIS